MNKIRFVFNWIKKRVANVYAYLTQSLFRKLLFSFFATITVTVTTLGSYSYIQTSSDIKQREIHNMEKLSEQSAAKLETQMSNIKSTAWNYFADSRFQIFVMTLGSDPGAYSEFSNKFSQFVTDNPEVEFIVAMQLEGNRLIKGNIDSTDVVDFEQMKEIAIANDGKGAWVSSIAFNRSLNREVSTLTFVQAIKKINFFPGAPVVGVMMIQLSCDYLTRWLAGIGEQERASYLLMDSANNAVKLSANPSLIGRRLDGLQNREAMDRASSDPFLISSFEGEEALYVSHPLAHTSWSLVGIVKVGTLLREINTLARNMIYIGMICLLGGMLIASVLSSRILNPLKELKKGILAVEKGDYGIILPVRSKDETGYILHRFNQMAIEIKALILKVYETDLVRKEAEIKSLQSQINPHFLYNALGIIDSLAALQEDERIGLISRSLAKMFRYNISAGRMFTLQSELRQIQSYLYIQQQRYGDRFCYIIDVDEDLLDVQIPKLLFQPLVENCFVHAFDHVSSYNELQIKARSLSEREFKISVWNNGPVIAPERLEELQAMLSQGFQQRHSQKSSSSIGLMNVQNRVKLLYGDEYGLTVTSEPAKGTEVVIHLRRLSEEEQRNEAVDH